jgi:acyl transferase domain-containing protein
MKFEHKKTVFLFPGQGSQNIGMAGSLYRHWPWFKKGIDDLFSLCTRNDMAPLNAVMLGLNGYGELLKQTMYTQPILYALEVMLARIWSRWGLVPSAVLGHSLGEIAAAERSGVFSPEDGMRLAFERGRLMQELQISGKYALVFGESSDVIEIVFPYKPDVVIGGSNGPNITVVSGLQDAVDAVLRECTNRGMKYSLLNVTLPFHSPLMEPMLEALERCCQDFNFEQPSIPWFSTMTGQCLKTYGAVDIDYWKSQIIEPVRFWAGMVAVSEQERCIFLEVGSGRTLINMGKQAIESENHLWLPSLDAKKNDFDVLASTALALHNAGASISMEKVHNDLQAIRRFPVGTSVA